MLLAYLGPQTAATILDQIALVAGKFGYISLVLICGALAYYFITKAVKINGVGRANATWNVLSTTLGVIIGILFLGEKLTKRNMLGIVFACIGLYLMDGLLLDT